MLVSLPVEDMVLTVRTAVGSTGSLGRVMAVCSFCISCKSQMDALSTAKKWDQSRVLKGVSH
jgi:D-serine dehydratase